MLIILTFDITPTIFLGTNLKGIFNLLSSVEKKQDNLKNVDILDKNQWDTTLFGNQHP